MVDSRPRTRAFLFADVRGYSAYVDRYGDAAGEQLIANYRRLVREALAAFSGAEIRTEGDSFYVVFDSVAAAVEAGLAIRDAALRTPLRGRSGTPVGIGIHAGESHDGEHGIVSSAVNIAARVCAIAPAGQVMVTDTVRTLIRTASPVQFRAAGRRRLKGIAEPVRLYRVDRGAQTAAATPMARPAGGVAITALLAIAVTAGILGLGPRRDAPSGVVEPTVTGPNPSIAPTVQAGGLSRFTDQGEFPNEFESSLLGRLADRLAARCERADVDETPEFYFTASNEGFTRPVPLQTRVGLDCLTSDVRAFYWQASGSESGIGNADELFFDMATRLGLGEGDCRTESGVHGAWAAGAHSGYLMCFVDAEGHAQLRWTFTGANVFAAASRLDADRSALYEWWRDTGRLLGR